MKLVRVRELRSVGAALPLLLLLNGIASAGMQEALRTLFDNVEASNPVRDFVQPLAGSDVKQSCVGAACPDGPPPPSPGPALRYNWNTGNLSATIPAAVLDVGAPPIANYEKIYTLADLVIDTRMLTHDVVAIDSTVFGWQLFSGPLEVLPPKSSISRNDTSLVWRPLGHNLPPSWMPPNGPVAAVVDFGFVLPPALSQAELEHLIFPDPSLNFVAYVNHRGAISFRAPLSIESVPEPSTGQAVIVTLVIACLILTGWRGGRLDSRSSFAARPPKERELFLRYVYW